MSKGLIVVSSLISIIIEPYVQSISKEDLNVLGILASSDDTDLISKNSVIINLVKWFETEKCRLIQNSRTGSLWISYLDYVMVVQNFIRAERTHNWLLHVDATQRMLNLFSATGHNNYAKSCRLYLQTCMDLECNFPKLYEQFMLGNHTVIRTEKCWSGIWTDLAIEQILMKSMKGRGESWVVASLRM